MVIKKTKESDFSLSKNNGESVKYRIRKQEEKEAFQDLKEFEDENTSPTETIEDSGRNPLL